MKIRIVILILLLSAFSVFENGRGSFAWLTDSQYRRIYERSRIESEHFQSTIKTGSTKGSPQSLKSLFSSDWDNVCSVGSYGSPNDLSDAFPMIARQVSSLRHFHLGEYQKAIVLIKDGIVVAVIVTPWDTYHMDNTVGNSLWPCDKRESAVLTFDRPGV